MLCKSLFILITHTLASSHKCISSPHSTPTENIHPPIATFLIPDHLVFRDISRPYTPPRYNSPSRRVYVSAARRHGYPNDKTRPRRGPSADQLPRSAIRPAEVRGRRSCRPAQLLARACAPAPVAFLRRHGRGEAAAHCRRLKG